MNTDTRAVPDADMKIIRLALRKAGNTNVIGNMALKLTAAQKKQAEYERKVLSNPKYKPVINNEKKIAELLDDITKKTAELEYYTLYRDDRFGSIEEFLMRMEYIDSQRNVTPYGLMVSYVNDCNPFILAEIFTSGILQKMEIRDIIIYCSILIDPIVSSNKIERTPSMIDGMKVSELVKQGVHFIAGRIEAYRAAEKDVGSAGSASTDKIESDEAYWDISLDYIELTSLWCDMDLNTEDHSRILQKLTDLDEYEGSFIKNMLKLNTIVKNLISITDLVSNFELLPKLEQAEHILVKGIVNTDSLHVMV
jgi:superfamily II RNA helicase